jgi:nitroreductase
MAMIGWLKQEDEHEHSKQRFSTSQGGVSSSSGRTSSPTTPRPPVLSSSSSRDLSSIGTSLMHHHHSPSQDSSSRYEERLSLASSRKDQPDLRRLFSSYTVSEEESTQGYDQDQASGTVSQNESSSPQVAVDERKNGTVDLAVAFQNMLQTRRTSSHFAPRLLALPSSFTSNSYGQDQQNQQEQQVDVSYWMGALERAVICGCSAPNHKRTEPFTFKRMVGPSEKTERLADIAYHVSLRQQQEESATTGASPEQIEEKATKRREKWSRIPAFLVTLSTCDNIVADPDLVETMDEYDQLPYSAPVTERDLEDYAAASSAVQNVLLSLHSEHIASKWVTGPVIRTPAFRELVQASPHDRIVSLIMIGHADESKRLHQRRRRRPLHGDVLVDL